MDGRLHSNLIITGRCISAAVRLSIKVQLSKRKNSELNEKSNTVEDFLVALENLFYHGVKYDGETSKIKWKSHPWSLFSLLFNSRPSFGVHIVKALDHIQDNFSRLRAWLKVLLINHCFVSVLSEVQQYDAELSRYYHGEALIRSSDLTVIIKDAVLLDQLQYSFDLKDSECNYNGVPPIDYSVYIYTGQPLDTSVCSTTSSCSGLMNRRDREIRYLKDAHNKALEKANRLEQLLAERDDQLKFQADALAANSELRQDLECQVLELQIQVTLFHEQCVQELRKAGITETRLKPPTIRRWNDVSERRRRLVDQACSVAIRPSGMNRVSHKTTFQHRTGVHLSRGPTPSILNVDQGIDALSYQSSESGSRSMTSSVKSGRSTRPKSLLITPGIFRDEVEVGQEIDVEDNLPLSHAPSTSPQGVTDGFVSTASGFGGNYLPLNMRVTEPSSGYGASYHRSQSHPESPADSQSPIHFGIQQMPESGEKFVLITDRPSPSTLSSAYSLNELSTVGVHKSTRPYSDDAQFPRGKHPMNRPRPFLAPTRFCPTPSADKSHSSDRGSSLHHSQTTSPRFPDLPRFSEKSPTIQHLQSTLLENQALIDSLTSDDRMDASSEFDSHDMMNSNKDFYQLTSQSDEEFVSDSEIAVENLCSPRLVISAHKLRPDLSTKSKPSAPIQPIASSLSTNPDAITRDPSVPPDITTSCDT